MPEIIAHTDDGTVLHFPDGTDPSTIQNSVKQHISTKTSPQASINFQSLTYAKAHGGQLPTVEQQGQGFNSVIDATRQVLPPAAGAVAGAAAAPVTGGLGSFAVGTTAYTALDTLLKRLKTGDKPSLGEDVAGSGIDALVNETGGRLLGGAASTVKSFNKLGTPDPSSILNLKPTASQALASTGDHSVAASVMKFLEDHFAPGAKKAAQDESGKLGSQRGFNLAAKEAGRSSTTIQNPNQMSDLINGQLTHQETIPAAYEILPGTGTVKKTPFATDPASLDKLIRDPVKLQDALSKSQAAGLGYNVRQDMAGYQLSRIQQAATTQAADGSFRIDANKAIAALNDPEMIASNKILFKGSQGLSNAQQFYKNLSYTQDKPGTSRILRYANTVGIPISLLHSAISGNAAGAITSGTVVGLELTAAGLAKALTNPQSGRLMLALANKEALGVSDAYAARMIMKSLTGTGAYLVNSDGSKQPVQVGQGGELR